MLRHFNSTDKLILKLCFINENDLGSNIDFSRKLEQCRWAQVYPYKTSSEYLFQVQSHSLWEGGGERGLRNLTLLSSVLHACHASHWETPTRKWRARSLGETIPNVTQRQFWATEQGGEGTSIALQQHKEKSHPKHHTPRWSPPLKAFLLSLF